MIFHYFVSSKNTIYLNVFFFNVRYKTDKTIIEKKKDLRIHCNYSPIDRMPGNYVVQKL